MEAALQKSKATGAESAVRGSTSLCALPEGCTLHLASSQRLDGSGVQGIPINGHRLPRPSLLHSDASEIR